MDDEVMAALAALARGAVRAPLPEGDWRGRRERAHDSLPGVLGSGYGSQVRTRRVELPRADGSVLAVDWVEPERQSERGSDASAADRAAVVYVHGGGTIFGSAAIWARVVGDYVRDSGVPMASVDYRLAPEAPYPAAADDVAAALVWVADHAGELGVDPARLAVMGDSAGGLLAASACQRAAAAGGPAIARQLLVYPMLDDRTTTAPDAIARWFTWTAEDNRTGWSAYLSGGAGDGLAVPARTEGLAGLSPAYLEVGALDLFAGETMRYAERLRCAGVPVELHVHPGAPHGFDVYAPHSAVAQRARADRLRVLRAL